MEIKHPLKHINLIDALANLVMIRLFLKILSTLQNYLAICHKIDSIYSIPTRHPVPKFGFEYLRWQTMHMRGLLGYKISEMYGATDKSHPRKFLKRIVKARKYGFEFDLSQSLPSKRLKMSGSTVAPSDAKEVILFIICMTCYINS